MKEANKGMRKQKGMVVGTYIKKETKLQKSPSEEVTLNWDIRDKREEESKRKKHIHIGLKKEFKAFQELRENRVIRIQKRTAWSEA